MLPGGETAGVRAKAARGATRSRSAGGWSADLRRPAARRAPAPLRLPARAGRGAGELGRPEGHPARAGQRHLAVHVEDHPLDYASFEGEIPAGQYGAGTVEIWDRGTYELFEEKPDGGLTVRLAGERLQGTWTLVPAKLDGDEKNWLLLRKQDEAAPARRRAATTSPCSPRWRRRRRRAEVAVRVKWDGYRALAYVAAETCADEQARQRPHRRFASVARCPRARRAHARLRPRRRGLCARRAGALELQRHAAGLGPARLLRFDVLEIDGEPVADLPLREPGSASRAARPAADTSGSRRSSRTERRSTRGAGAGPRGIVAKKADSRYQPGRRTRDWLKVKTHLEQEFVVAGYEGEGRRAGRLGSLVLGVMRGRGRLCG